MKTEQAQFTDDQILAAIDTEIEEIKGKPGHTLRVRYIRCRLLSSNHRGKYKTGALSLRIRKLAETRGYYPDPEDPARPAQKNTRLYKMQTQQ